MNKIYAIRIVWFFLHLCIVDSNGVEVDLLETQNEVVSLTEIKSGTTYLPSMANNLNKIAALFHPNSCQKALVYGGGESFRVKDLAVQSWSLIK